MVGITPGMQNLHRDLATLGMHSIRHLSVLCRFSPGGEFPRERLDPPGPVWCITARDDQTDIAPGPLGKIGRETVVFVAVFKPGMHRAHEYPVLQRREAEIEWSKQVRVSGVGHGR